MKISKLIPLISGIALSNCGTEEQIIQNVIKSLDPKQWSPDKEDSNWTLPTLPEVEEAGCEVCAWESQKENNCWWYTPENESKQCSEGYILIKREEACEDYQYGCAVDL